MDHTSARCMTYARAFLRYPQLEIDARRIG